MGILAGQGNLQPPQPLAMGHHADVLARGFQLVVLEEEF
jgi:hypothetical protein